MDIDYSRWIAAFQPYRPAPNQGDLLLVAELGVKFPITLLPRTPPSIPTVAGPDIHKYTSSMMEIFLPDDLNLSPLLGLFCERWLH